MSSSCRTKTALFQGCRPSLSTPQQANATQQILYTACPSSCIYCDIWKLATLIASHVPLSARYDLFTGSPVNSPVSSNLSSPIGSSPVSPTQSRTIPYSKLISACRTIEAQFQTQRSQLNSIISICTVSGADETEGLRMAHDRCCTSVEDLLDQEEDLEECLLRDLQETQATYEYNDYAYAGQSQCYPQDRRQSMINVAI